ncbi:MAG: hypothetical protein PF487_10295, partial [Bacteroidales bacterium]|nr:hypothetical protein [Bacteroidales bacterium]
FIKEKNIEIQLSKKMLKMVYQYPKMDFESILSSIEFKFLSYDDIISKIPFLLQKYSEIHISKDNKAKTSWIMGELQKSALGNISPKKLITEINNSNKK